MESIQKASAPLVIEGDGSFFDYADARALMAVIKAASSVKMAPLSLIKPVVYKLR